MHACMHISKRERERERERDGVHLSSRERQHIGTSQICQGTDFGGFTPLVGRKKRNVKITLFLIPVL